MLIICYKEIKDVLLSFSKLDEVGELETVYHSQKPARLSSIFRTTYVRTTSVNTQNKQQQMLIDAQKVDHTKASFRQEKMN